MRLAGEMAAVGTAVCWACGATMFVVAGRRMGSMVLNRLRLTAAAVLLIATHWAVHRAPWPTWATSNQLEILALSALLGFVLGDSLYFRSLVILGAGKATLILSMSPVFTALLAWIFLHETLGPRAFLGMAIVLAGLAVVLYRRDHTESHAEGSALVGIMSGIGSALFSSAGYIMSKHALQGGLDALSGTTIRVVSAVPMAWILAPIFGGTVRSIDALRDRVGTWTMLGGAVCGPFLGVTFSLYALQHTQAAVASSIFSCFPLLAILLAARFHHEPLTLRTLGGALVTVAGVVILFLR